MPQCVLATLLLSESTNFYGSGSALDDEDGTTLEFFISIIFISIKPQNPENLSIF